MALRFDHAIIAVNDLETTIVDYTAMGFTVIPGGEHASGTTHNALICFQDGAYIELLAPTGKPPKPDVQAADFRSMLEKGEGLVGYALIADNLSETVMAMRARGVVINDPQPGSRKRTDGVELRWQSAMLPGSIAPFFIEDETARNLRVPEDADITTHANGAIGVKALTIIAPQFEIMTEQFTNLIGIVPRIYETWAEFSLATTVLSLVKPEDDTMQAYAEQRGDSPYELAIHAPQRPTELLDLEKTHSAHILLG